MELNVRINNIDTKLEGKQAEAVSEYSKLLNESASYAEAKKAVDKKIKAAKGTIDGVLEESQKLFNDSNTIEIMSLTGNAVAESFTVTSKAAPKKELINKKALVSLIANGVQDGWITIDSQAFIDYLKGQQFVPGLEMDQLEEKLAATDFTTLLDKTRELPKYNKEDINIKQNEIKE